MVFISIFILLSNVEIPKLRNLYGTNKSNRIYSKYVIFFSEKFMYEIRHCRNFINSTIAKTRVVFQITGTIFILFRKTLFVKPVFV